MSAIGSAANFDGPRPLSASPSRSGKLKPYFVSTGDAHPSRKLVAVDLGANKRNPDDYLAGHYFSSSQRPKSASFRQHSKPVEGPSTKDIFDYWRQVNEEKVNLSSTAQDSYNYDEGSNYKPTDAVDDCWKLHKSVNQLPIVDTRGQAPHGHNFSQNNGIFSENGKISPAEVSRIFRFEAPQSSNGNEKSDVSMYRRPGSASASRMLHQQYMRNRTAIENNNKIVNKNSPKKTVDYINGLLKSSVDNHISRIRTRKPMPYIYNNAGRQATDSPSSKKNISSNTNKHPENDCPMGESDLEQLQVSRIKKALFSAIKSNDEDSISDIKLQESRASKRNIESKNFVKSIRSLKQYSDEVNDFMSSNIDCKYEVPLKQPQIEYETEPPIVENSKAPLVYEKFIENPNIFIPSEIMEIHSSSDDKNEKSLENASNSPEQKINSESSKLEIKEEKTPENIPESQPVSDSHTQIETPKVSIPRSALFSEINSNKFKLKKVTKTEPVVSASVPPADIICEESKVMWNSMLKALNSSNRLYDLSYQLLCDSSKSTSLLGNGKYAKVIKFSLEQGFFDGPPIKLFPQRYAALESSNQVNNSVSIKTDESSESDKNIAVKYFQYNSKVQVECVVSRQNGASNRHHFHYMPPKAVIQELDREISFLLDAAHPNIVELRGVFLGIDCFGLALEHMNGNNLGTNLDDTFGWQHFVSTSDRIKIALQIISAINYMHSKQFVHRDIKPQNILLNFEADRTWTVKLSDFGTAVNLKTLEDRLFDAIGTSGYSAPEVLLCDGISSDTTIKRGYHYPCDIFSFGIVLWKLFCNPHLFSPDLLDYDAKVDKSEKIMEEFRQTFVNPFVGKDSQTAYELICSGIRPYLNHDMFPLLIVDVVTASWKTNDDDRPSSQNILQTILGNFL